MVTDFKDQLRWNLQQVRDDATSELIDGQVGHRRAVSNLPEWDAGWSDYRARLQAVADGAR